MRWTRLRTRFGLILSGIVRCPPPSFMITIWNSVYIARDIVFEASPASQWLSCTDEQVHRRDEPLGFPLQTGLLLGSSACQSFHVGPQIKGSTICFGLSQDEFSASAAIMEMRQKTNFQMMVDPLLVLNTQVTCKWWYREAASKKENETNITESPFLLQCLFISKRLYVKRGQLPDSFSERFKTYHIS